MDAARREHCLQALRELDRDRYLACLLAPEDRRDALVALALFNAEIARIRDVVREPMAGEMRFQWWRDVIAGTGSSGPGGHPAAEALVETIERHDLPQETFAAYLEARTFDLYDDPMPDRTSFEGYAGETSSALLQLGVMTLDAEASRLSAEAAGHAGVAQLVAGTLLLMPVHSARGQVYVPGDILAACGLNRDAFLATDEVEAVSSVRSALLALGREHLERARDALDRVPSEAFAAFLPVGLVDQVFARADRRHGDPRREAPATPQWRRQMRLFRTAWFGRI